MWPTLKVVTRCAPVLLVFAGAGCSVVQSVNQIRDAKREITSAEEAVADGDYDAGLKSYLGAKRLLQAARDAGLQAFADDRKMEALDKTIRSLEEKAVAEGFVRVDDRYCDEGELVEALGKALGAFFRSDHLRSVAVERVVADDIQATARKKPDNTRDIALSIVLKDTGEDHDFLQDTWAIVRFLLEGGYGHGFSYHIAHPFEKRPWMGGEGGWGISDKPDTVNHFIGLKKKVANLSISVYRGHYRQGAERKYGRYGFESLEAVGPYWERAHFITYSMDAAHAARLNWDEAGRITDATLYGLLKISEQESAETEESASSTSTPRVE